MDIKAEKKNDHFGKLQKVVIGTNSCKGKSQEAVGSLSELQKGIEWEASLKSAVLIGNESGTIGDVFKRIN